MEVEDGVGLERVAKSTADLSGPVRQVGARMLDAHCVKVGYGAATRNLQGYDCYHVLLVGRLLIGREGFARGSGSPKRDGSP